MLLTCTDVIFCNFALAYKERHFILLNKVTLIDKFRKTPLLVSCDA